VGAPAVALSHLLPRDRQTPAPVSGRVIPSPMKITPGRLSRPDYRCSHACAQSLAPTHRQV